MTDSSDTLLRRAIGTAIAGPSPPGRVFSPAAKADLLPDPDCYVVFNIDLYGNQDGFSDLVDLTVDIYGFTAGAHAGPDDVNKISTGLDAALRGVVLPNCGGTITTWARVRKQPLPTGDARITRTRLIYQATWSSMDTAIALERSI